MSMKRTFSLSMLVYALGLLSCKLPPKEAAKAPEHRDHLVEGPAHIPPNHARIEGEIVELDSTSLEAPDVAGPCSRVPCVASVRIGSVLGLGVGFPQPFQEGMVVRMKFAYTLDPSQRHFPEMQPAFPGLHLGSKFKADVMSQVTLAGDITPRFVVFAYEVQ